MYSEADISFIDRSLLESAPSPRTSWTIRILLVLFGAGAMLAAWMLVQEAAKRHLIRELASATTQSNVAVLVDGADWPTLRNEMKRDLKQRAQFNASLPFKPQVVDELVDYYVRAEKVPELLEYYHLKAAHMNPEAFIREVHFSGLTEMTVEMAPPQQFDKPWLNRLEPVRAVFQLVGLSWKLKKLDAPDYLIPSAVPSKG